MDIAKTVGENLKAARKAKGVTQNKLRRNSISISPITAITKREKWSWITKK